MLSIGTNYALDSLETMLDQEERKALLHQPHTTSKDILELSSTKIRGSVGIHLPKKSC